MSNILFCGSYFPQCISERIRYHSQAANNFQDGVIRELHKKNKVDILTYVGYPWDSSLESIGDVPDMKICIRYIFKAGYKSFLPLFKSYYRAFNELLTHKDMVILYNYNYINLLVNFYCHRKRIKTALIVADHSEPIEYRNPVRKALAGKYAKDYNKFDYLVFLSRELRKRYERKPSFLMEGGIDPSRFLNFKPGNPKEKLTICYLGLLSKVTGVDLFLEAIRLVTIPDVSFCISGKGELEELVKQYAKTDQRIKYLGFLEEEKYLECLNNANILVNPRKMYLPQNKNNFPSKVLEYLAAGKVTISTTFPGFEKFRDHFLFCDPRPVDLANAIAGAVRNYEGTYENQFFKNRKKAEEFHWDRQIRNMEEFLGLDGRKDMEV